MRRTILRKGPELRQSILLAVVLITPLFFLRNSYNVFNVPKLSLLMVGVAVVAAIRAVELLQGGLRSSIQPVLIAAAGMAGALGIGTAFSPYRVWSLIGDHSRFTGMVPYLVVILFGILVADTFSGEPRLLAWVFVISGAIAASYGIVQVVGLDPLEWSASGQATTTIGNTNFSGAFFAICLPVALGLLLSERDRRLYLVAATALIVGGWIVASSELAWGAGIAALLVFGGTIMRSRWPLARMAGLSAAAAISMAGVLVVGLAMTDDPPRLIPGTIERRAEWWEASLRMAAGSPVVGRGPNSFAIEHSHHRDVDDVIAVGFDITDDPHSVPLAFLLSAGIFGISGFVGLAAVVIAGLLKTRPDQLVTAGFGAAAIAYLVQSLLSVDVVTLTFAAWTVIGGLAAGLASRLPDFRRPPPRTMKKRKMKEAPEPLRAVPGVIAVLVFATASVVWATGFLVADIAFKRGLSPAARGAQAQEDLRSAINFRETNDTYRRHYGVVLGANAVRQSSVEGGDEALARAFLQEARETFSFVDDFPHSGSVLSYARIIRDWAELHSSAEDEALALYVRAFELDPNNFLILNEQAAAASAFGRDDLARELSERSAQLQQSADD